MTLLYIGPFFISAIYSGIKMIRESKKNIINGLFSSYFVR